MDIVQLFECPLCMGIPEREREQFIEGFDYSVKSYMKGDVVFRQGDVCRFLYILLEGEVEAEMTDDSGAMLRIETIRAPRALAPAFLFAEDNHFPVRLMCLSPRKNPCSVRWAVMKVSCVISCP